MKSVERMLRGVFGGCPERKVCSLYHIESKTCIYGPYQYCGKYRSISEQKSKLDMSSELLRKDKLTYDR